MAIVIRRILFLLVVALLTFGCSKDGGSIFAEQTTTTHPSNRDVEQGFARPGDDVEIGEKVKDGDLVFVVKKFECKKQKCVADVESRVLGQIAIEIGSSHQLTTANHKSPVRLDEKQSTLDGVVVKPGSVKRGTLVWRIPSKFKPYYVDLHRTGTSDGASVNIWFHEMSEDEEEEEE